MSSAPPAPPQLGVKESVGLSMPGSAIAANEILNQLAAVEIAQDANLAGTAVTEKQKKLVSMSKWANESMHCKVFLERWDCYKKKADAVFTEGKGKDKDFPTTCEFDLMSEGMNAEWKKSIDTGLAIRARQEGVDPDELPKRYARGQIDAIRALGYELTDEMVTTLMHALTRFFICDIGPAAFSIYAVLGDDTQKANKMVTVSHHCLQMATHFVRHPPGFLTVRELDELVCLALFHDVYYYDDYLHHDEKVVEIFEPFLETEVCKAVAGHHLNIKPDLEKVRDKKPFESNLDVLKQEWVQMDWYLTMVNLQKESPKKGLSMILPLEFYHHCIGRVLTGSNVLPMTPEELARRLGGGTSWTRDSLDKKATNETAPGDE